MKNKSTAVWLLIFGVFGWLASSMLTYEKFKTLTETDYKPACDINPLLSCGAAMGSWQGSLLGFPNSLLGIVGFTVVITLSVVALSGVRLPQWLTQGLWIGALLGQGLIFFLMYTSLFVLGVICPWCFVVWLAQWPIFVLTSAQIMKSEKGIGRVLNRQKTLIVVLGYGVAAILIAFTLGEQFRLLL